MSQEGRLQKNIGIATNGVHTMNLNGRFGELFAVATITTAGAVTLTAAQLLGGVILRDPNGSARTDTTPTATLLRDAMGYELVDNLGFMFLYRNDADAAETITLAGGTGVTISGTATIAQNNSKLFLALLTDKAPTPTFVIYSIGTFVH